MGETLKTVLKVGSVVLFVTLLGLSLFIILQVNKSAFKFWKHEAEKAIEEVEPEDCKVTTDKGVIVGQKMQMHHINKSYYAFQGIPYAQPPVGDLRFKDPQPIQPWKDDLYAKKEKSFCPQDTKYLFLNKGIAGSEDCLYVNVYIPQRPGKEITLKPVMIWIHGGGFVSGSGHSDIYGPDYLVEDDVILVTFNYRLGVLGFLNLGIEEASGNAGMKDQVEVLKWVQKNIRFFGGDPDNVTLFGNNAGSVSTQLHQLSPLSKGLFHKVILQSGSVLNPWAFEKEPLKVAISFANLTEICLVIQNSKDANKKAILDCLKKIETDKLVAFQDDIVDLERMTKLEYYPFLPSVETSNSTNKFLTSDPIEDLMAGRFVEVPTIMGINNAEANILYFDNPDFLTPSVISLINFSSDVLVPSVLKLKNQDRQKVIKNIYELILKTKLLSWLDFPRLRDVLSDCAINMGMFITLNTLSKLSKPLYVYEFTFTGKLNYIGNIAKNNFDEMKKKYFPEEKQNAEKTKDLEAIEMQKMNLAIELDGACHADEIGYLFRVNKLNVDVDSGSAENRIRTEMCKFWTNFAKHGFPSEKDDSKWPESKADSKNVLEIGEKIEIKKSTFESERFEFWEKVLSDFVLSKK